METEDITYSVKVNQNSVKDSCKNEAQKAVTGSDLIIIKTVKVATSAGIDLSCT